MLISYPKDLKLPLLSSHGLAQKPNLLRTEMSSGRARQRKRFQSVPTILSASWKLNPYQAQLFEGFVTHGTGDAVNWFVMPLLTPQGVVEHEVRFIQSPLESCSFSGGFWNYSANIEIKKRQVISEEVTATQLLAPNSIQQFVDGISAALDTYQEQ
ncbi:hypothetical protein [Pseudoalteromonas sp. T1lg22]|uniref:hypothetical protein n=1 Tax=Pseudoalteromonas sp. T1lg22 TaxID=2077096 RepID=UPI000CF662BD|nr:hypothetical protein [Pseudoalteromonas sp. T1lg22]